MPESPEFSDIDPSSDDQKRYYGVVERYLKNLQTQNDAEELLKRIHNVQDEEMCAKGLHTVVITDPDHASILAERHQLLNIKQLVLEFGETDNTDWLEKLRQDVWRNGGFFQDYDAQSMKKRLKDSMQDPNESGWKIVESRGCLLRKKDLSESPEVAGGDIQVRIPSVRAQSLVKVLLLDEAKYKDKIEENGRQVWAEIMENPAMVAWISDVCSLRGRKIFGNQYHPPLGFASTASEGVFQEIRKINQERKIPVQWALSAVAEVTHILDRAKATVTKLVPTLINQRGIDLTRRNRVDRSGQVYRNLYLGMQRARDMAVNRISGSRGYLRFNWHILAQEIWRPGDEKLIKP